MSLHLTVIAKEPRPGFVKSRLCPPCTPGEAADIAAAALLDTLDAIDRVIERSRVGGLDVTPVLLFDGETAGWVRPGYEVVAQRGDDLATRLANAFDDLGPGLVVGMEVPSAIPHLTAALPTLRSGADVLGLAVDGGYWAIGLHRADPAVFRDVPMSTSVTGLVQLSRLHALRRSVRLLPMVHDLDTIADLRIAATDRPGADIAARLPDLARRVLARVDGAVVTRLGG